MGQDSKIEWCTHTLNPWIGCTKVSDGCKHCYAEAMMDHRYGKVKWGPNGTRNRTTEANWKQAIKWNLLAKEAGERHRSGAGVLTRGCRPWHLRDSDDSAGAARRR